MSLCLTGITWTAFIALVIKGKKEVVHKIHIVKHPLLYHTNGTVNVSNWITSQLSTSTLSHKDHQFWQLNAEKLHIFKVIMCNWPGTTAPPNENWLSNKLSAVKCVYMHWKSTCHEPYNLRCFPAQLALLNVTFG